MDGRRPNYGKHGRQLHEALVNAIRFDAIESMREMYATDDEGPGDPDDLGFGIIADEQLMGMLGLGPVREKGCKIPDLLYGDDYGFVLIEVGCCQLDKWAGEPVIHVGFDGSVTFVGPHRDEMLDDLIWCIQRAVEKRLAAFNSGGAIASDPAAPGPAVMNP